MSTKVWCEDCERYEVVCECVDKPERDNACYELEQLENCEHPQEVEFSATPVPAGTGGRPRLTAG